MKNVLMSLLAAATLMPSAHARSLPYPGSHPNHVRALSATKTVQGLYADAKKLGATKCDALVMTVSRADQSWEAMGSCRFPNNNDSELGGESAIIFLIYGTSFDAGNTPVIQKIERQFAG